MVRTPSRSSVSGTAARSQRVAEPVPQRCDRQLGDQPPRRRPGDDQRRAPGAHPHRRGMGAEPVRPGAEPRRRPERAPRPREHRLGARRRGREAARGRRTPHPDAPARPPPRSPRAGRSESSQTASARTGSAGTRTSAGQRASASASRIPPARRTPPRRPRPRRPPAGRPARAPAPPAGRSSRAGPPARSSARAGGSGRRRSAQSNTCSYRARGMSRRDRRHRQNSPADERIRIAIALIAALSLAACGGEETVVRAPAERPRPDGEIPGGADPAEARVIDEWAMTLSEGDVDGAARFFAIPSVAENGPALIQIRDLDDARLFNASLPCGAELARAVSEGDFVVATFRLTERPGPGSCGSGTGEEAQTAFVIEDGRDRRVAAGRRRRRRGAEHARPRAARSDRAPAWRIGLPPVADPDRNAAWRRPRRPPYVLVSERGVLHEKDQAGPVAPCGGRLVVRHRRLR